MKIDKIKISILIITRNHIYFQCTINLSYRNCVAEFKNATIRDLKAFSNEMHKMVIALEIRADENTLMKLIIYILYCSRVNVFVFVFCMSCLFRQLREESRPIPKYSHSFFRNIYAITYTQTHTNIHIKCSIYHIEDTIDDNKHR